MFNGELKKRIKELKQSNERLQSIVKDINIEIPKTAKGNDFANLISRIIEKTKYAEYHPFQEELLSFILNELKIIRDKVK